MEWYSPDKLAIVIYWNCMVLHWYFLELCSVVTLQWHIVRFIYIMSQWYVVLWVWSSKVMSLKCYDKIMVLWWNLMIVWWNVFQMVWCYNGIMLEYFDITIEVLYDVTMLYHWILQRYDVISWANLTVMKFHYKTTLISFNTHLVLI